MINVQKAQEIILNTTPKAKIESIGLNNAYGRVLAKELRASRHQPPFHRVAMDGIGVNTVSKIDSFKIENVQAAGSPQLKLKDKKNCLEVMTGAVLPDGCNCVIPYEKVEIKDGIAKISLDDLVDMNNIHKKASDYKENDLLLEAGTHITSAVTAIIASQGNKTVSVFKLPKVVVISTGSELVDLDNPIEEYQIFMSNSYGIESELRNFGLKDVTRRHIVDDKERTEAEIKKCLENFDLIILTGGISRGKFDFIPDVLNNLGVEKHFHKIEQKPGKPMFYGTKKCKQIFALPGNPVSCLICLRRYVILSLTKSLGITPKIIFGKLQSEIKFKQAFTYFVAVKTEYSKNGELLLNPIGKNSSGDFNSLGLSDGLIELPADKAILRAGETYQFFPWNI